MKSMIYSTTLIIFVITSIGCNNICNYDLIDHFHESMSQEDIDILDKSELKGAIVLIGILELEADWQIIHNYTGSKYIHIRSIRNREGEYSSELIELPNAPNIVHLLINNKYVMEWAHLHHKDKIEYIR